jgi:MFS family permease
VLATTVLGSGIAALDATVVNIALPAIGAWSGLSGVAIAAGPLIGGYLLSVASSRWIFFIDVPIAAAVVALGARHIPESRDPASGGCLHCGLDAPPLTATVSRAPGT